MKSREYVQSEYIKKVKQYSDKIKIKESILKIQCEWMKSREYVQSEFIQKVKHYTDKKKTN